ncbi:MAG: proteasome-type protease [Gomphosphaeria aponina SAG 52.96 = DSM 107014]|uniref:Proteasome-type protease n=1 Tax=Gomphosphaeria aponina SAG 52.96 = DSM 107014 TaxID=1521640 RepID=A0A941GPD4_9CHRO|nr:proteasome-type protease [Gomphosphaeria aponina SAG 52.96 = DSM 107014]
MTYCLGIINRFGIVMGSDSLTNAGVDYTSIYQKLFDFSVAGERVVLICCSGNLSITQGVLTRLQRDIQNQEEENLYTLPSMYELAEYVGSKSREIQNKERPWLEKDKIDYSCNFLLGGQIKGEEPHLYLIYTQGNYIQATRETPFLQIGEAKYGKPILDRTITPETPLQAMAKCALLSIDSTMKSNISVGPPIDLVMYEVNTFVLRHTLRLRLGAPYLAKIRKLWEESVREAFEAMPNIEWNNEEEELNQEDVFID